MSLQFTKMHGLGNDFMVIDAISQSVNLATDQIKFLADRHFGVGFDQLLLVEKPQNAGVDFRYRIFNADGGEVEQCGNGARCFARFVRDEGLTDKSRIRVETRSGMIELIVEESGEVTVDMGMPRFEPRDIPFIAAEEAERYTLNVNGKPVGLGVVSMGNPHAVMRVENVDEAPVADLGPLVERHPSFPNRVNVGFMQVVAPDHIRLRVFERGAGETLACGTGACAAVAVGIRWNALTSPVKVDLPGGQLRIAWEGGASHVMMTGPAATVFKGTIHL